jgi:uncharacterized membrane protein
MNTKSTIFSGVAMLTLLFFACKEENTPPSNPPASDKCASKNIVVTADVTASVTCKNNGSIKVKASGSTGFTYQMGSGAFGADSVFSNLSPGSYTITVKDADGCTKAATFTMTEAGTKGPTFSIVSSMIKAKCNLACHTAGTDGAPRGIFATDCNVISRSADIKTKAVDGSMGNLDANEKNQIMTWINAGAGYTD